MESPRAAALLPGLRARLARVTAAMTSPPHVTDDVTSRVCARPRAQARQRYPATRVADHEGNLTKGI